MKDFMPNSELTKDRKPLPKGKRARTRAALLQAASEVIGEEGFAGASLEAIAKRAGMSRGAIYGNFKNRDELFLAVALSRWRPIVPEIEPGTSFRDQMRKLADAWIAAQGSNRQAAVSAAAFQEYALTHEEMRLAIVELNREVYRRTAKRVRATIADSELPMPAAKLVRVLHSMIEGFTLLRALTPELITDDVVRTAFEALA